jgi:outer membrane protein assembly factor BamB
MINKTDWLTEQTYDKSIAFGKCYQQHIASKTYWRGVRIYTEDAIPPNGTETIDWNLMALFAKGKTIVNMDIVGNSLIASVNPNESVFETDAIEDLNPKTYILKDENSTVWGDPEGTVDSVYPTEVAALTSTGTYDKVLYSGSDYQEELFLQNRFDKILLSEITSIDPDTGKIIWAEDLYGLGDLYQRRKANAFDEIIIDTKAPETNIVLKENDTSGGIRVREINVFAEAQ